jgi:antitoxin component of RelBE/YafQ-DinJ toxin-antitoxin module
MRANAHMTSDDAIARHLLLLYGERLYMHKLLEVVSLSVQTDALSNRVDANLKREFDNTVADHCLSATTAPPVLMRRFVDEEGFPFDDRRRIPTEGEFAKEMDDRYKRMLAGHETQHDLLGDWTVPCPWDDRS